MSTDSGRKNTLASGFATTIMAALGCAAFVWLLAVKWFPDTVASFTPKEPSRGVVILDVVNYMQVKGNDVAADEQTIWEGLNSLVQNLSSQGYVVVEPSVVIGAPESSYVPISIIDQWVGIAIEGDASRQESFKTVDEESVDEIF